MSERTDETIPKREDALQGIIAGQRAIIGIQAARIVELTRVYGEVSEDLIAALAEKDHECG